MREKNKHHALSKFSSKKISLVMLKIKHHFALRKNPNDAYKTGLSVNLVRRARDVIIYIEAQLSCE